MYKTAVVDTSVLIALEKINMLDLLCKLYKTIILPKSVYNEFGNITLNCIEIREIYDDFQNILCINLGKGETEAILLAYRYKLPILIDDLKARKVAKILNLRVSGTIGLLLSAFQKGYVNNALDILLKLRDKGFYISENLWKEVEEFIRENPKR